MRIDDLYQTHGYTREIHTLHTNCTQFLQESRGQPLFKNLACSYGDFDKVKVRKRKEQNEFTETFNEAFEKQHPGLRQRAIFANGVASFHPMFVEGLEPFYVFPVNGYKFMYSREVENSGQEYKQVFDTLFEQFGEQRGNEVITDLLRFTYTSNNLHEGISSGSELIIYGIPCFYVVRTTVTEDYSELLSMIMS